MASYISRCTQNHFCSRSSPDTACQIFKPQLLNKLVAINHEGWMGGGRTTNTSATIQTKAKGTDATTDRTHKTTATEPQHTGQISTVCVGRHYCCWRLSPFFCVFYPLLFIRISPCCRAETKSNKCTTQAMLFCPFCLFYLFFGFFLLLQFPSSFNLPSRTVTIHHVCLNIVELPALLSPSAGIHNQSHMSWKNTFSKREKKRERKQTDKSKKCQ